MFVTGKDFMFTLYIRSLEHWLSYRVIALKPLEQHRDFLLEDYVGEQKTPTCTSLRGASPMSLYSAGSWGDSCY